MPTELWTFDQLCDAFGFNEAERKLVGAAVKARIPHSGAGASPISELFGENTGVGITAISELVLAKSIQNAAERVIDSNEKLSYSNEKHSKRMVLLTFALVFVGFMQAYSGAMQTYISIEDSRAQHAQTHQAQGKASTPPAKSPSPP